MVFVQESQALRFSEECSSPVRVVREYTSTFDNCRRFAYDGLYMVQKVELYAPTLDKHARKLPFVESDVLTDKRQPF